MVVTQSVPQIGLLSAEVLSFAMVLVIFGLGYRAVTESSSEDAEPEDGEQSAKATGFPLASWRYVYDVDKAEASREMASVNQQANDLAEAEKKARQR